MPSFLVVGLGNPGSDYALNRHNVGQMALDVLAERIGAPFKSHKANAKVAEGRLRAQEPAGEDIKLILARSHGFMNTSGGPVANLLKFYGLTPADLIVLHDELDIPAAEVRLKFGGGHGGHNGLRDIIAAIGTQDFARVRIGIGRPPGQMDAADYVLRNFGTAEKKDLAVTLELSADAVEAVARDGFAIAQNRVNQGDS
ncbi:MAG: aminoacyl-tRNA hydrolase [Actinomycetes bacterium]